VVYQRSLCNNQLTLGRICKIEVDEHLRAGRIAEAEQSLLRLRDHGAALVAEFPDQSIVARGLGDTYINLGYFYRRINRTKDELAAWQAAVKYAPDFAPSHKHLGLALIRSGRRDEGLAAMHRAISLDPKFVEGYGDLGATLINLGRPKEALEPLQRAIELKPDAVIALHALGMALNVLGRAAEAEPYLRRAIQAQPSFAMAHYNLGLSLTATGRHGDAKAALGQAIALNPNDANSLGTLAWLLATCPDKNLRDATQAVELANKAVDLSRGSARFRRTLGVAHYRAGNWKGAITGIGESIDLKSEGDSVDWFFLSMAHWQLGERETAKKYYAQAVEWMEKNKPKDDELRRFRAEAAELLAIKQ
jgi:tetratricopeptide (TPR) repeat protein